MHETLHTAAAEPLTDGSSVSPSDVTPFALIACQRSGAHLFTEIVNSNPCVALLAEPFYLISRPVYWRNFVRNLPPEKFPALFREDAMALMDRYLGVIRRDVCEDLEHYGGPKSQLRALGLDVKYNQLRSVTSLLADLRSPPLLIDYFRSRQFRVIHLIRKNIVHAALSLTIAKHRNVWTNDDSSVIQGKFPIHWEMLHYELKWIQHEREEFQSYAHDLPMHVCAYEDLVADLNRVDDFGNFPADTIAVGRLAELLGVANRFRFPGNQHRVINRPYSEILDRYDDLVKRLRDSQFSEFADTI